MSVFLSARGAMADKGFFGNQNKRRKLKHLQREQMRSRAKAIKAAKAAKKRQRREQLEQDGDESVAQPMETMDELVDADLTAKGRADGTHIVEETPASELAIDSFPTELPGRGEKLSKRKQKAIAKIEENKQKKANRAALFQALSASALTSAQTKLFLPSAGLGQRETLKQTLTRDLYFERAGLAALRQQEVHGDTLLDEGGAGRHVSQGQVNAKSAAKQAARKRRKLAKKEAKTALEAEREKLRAQAYSSSSSSGEDGEDSKALRQDDEVSIETTGATKDAATAIVTPEPEETKLREKAPGPLDIDASPTTDAEPRVRLPVEETPYVVHVQRDPDVQKERMQLPVCGMEQEIMEAITHHSFVILCGETGSGKTTQLPQFLYEAGYGDQNSNNPGMIGVTQPRRVAAMTMASRIAKELNVGWGRTGTVAHQIRYDMKTVGDKTRLKLMTDGVLLREIRSDFLLRKYSVIIIDEAHERGVNTDLLIGLLSRVVPLRAQLAAEQQARLRSPTSENKDDIIRPLKVVIMSATLQVKDFSDNRQLFPLSEIRIKRPVVMKVESRRYPITVHFNKYTPVGNDYIDATFRKVCKIHNKLPPGGILVFLTGKREILDFCQQLRVRYGDVQSSSSLVARGSADEEPALSLADGDKDMAEQSEEDNKDTHSGSDDDDDDDDSEVDADASRHERGDWELDEDGDFEEEEDVVVLNQEEGEASTDTEKLSEVDDKLPQHVLVLPLYAMLPEREQLRVFEQAPENTRVIVVSTNVAETSITIPGIRYVVDAGREKRRNFDKRTGSSSFNVEWISQASASQRSGRCGRTGPGHCYRLYSSAMFNDTFAPHIAPEILQRPIEDLFLNMKAMYIERVQTFPFPTSPSKPDMMQAFRTLQCLGALKTPTVDPAVARDDDVESAITDLGKRMALFPVSPRFSKMMLLGSQQNLLPYAIALVAALSVQAPFLSRVDLKAHEKTSADDEQQLIVDDEDSGRRLWRHSESDALAMLRVVGAYSHATDAANRPRHVKYKEAGKTFCKEYALHARTMAEIQLLRKQLGGIVKRTTEAAGEDFNMSISRSLVLPPPTPVQEALLLQVVGAGFIDRVARLCPEGTFQPPDVILEDPQAARQFRRRIKCAYQSCDPKLARKPLWIHPSSSVAAKDFRRLPQYIVYQEIVETSRPYMTRVTAISEKHIARLSQGTPLCTFSLPMDAPLPVYDKKREQVCGTSKPYFGPHRWALTPNVVPIADMSAIHGRGTSVTDDIFELETRWFARLLLEGNVTAREDFKALSSALTNRPTIFTHSRFNSFGQAVTQAFMASNVVSLPSLKQALEKQPRLLTSVLQNFSRDKAMVLEAWEKCKAGILAR